MRADHNGITSPHTDLPRAEYARACMYRNTSMNYYGSSDLLSQVSGFAFCTIITALASTNTGAPI